MVNILNVLISLVKKDLKILMRSKLSTFLILFGPFLLIFIIGTAFQSMNWHGINVGVYSQEYTPAAESLLNNLKVSQEIMVYKIPTLEKCKQKVETSELHICISLPNLNIGNNMTTGKIQMYVDYSRLNLAFALVDMMSGTIGKEKDRISLELTRTLIEKLQEVVEAVHQNSLFLDNFTGFGDDFSTKLESMQTDLAALDVDFNLSDLDLEGFADKINATVDQVKVLQELGNQSLTANRVLLDTLNNRIDSSEENLGNLMVQLDETETTLQGINEGCTEQLNTLIVVFIALKINDFSCETWESTYQEYFNGLRDYELSTLEEGDTTDTYGPLIASTDATCMCLTDLVPLRENIQGIKQTLEQEQDFTEVRLAIHESEGALTESSEFLASFEENIQSEVETISNQINDFKNLANSTKDDLTAARRLKENAEVEIGFIRTNLDSNLEYIDLVNEEIKGIDSSLTLFTNVRAEEVVQPITTQLIDLHSEKSTTFLMYPTLMILIMMLVGILAASTMVLAEKKTRASIRNFVTPIKPVMFLIGTYITNLIVLMTQLAFILLVGYFFFNIPIFDNFMLSGLVLFLIATTFILMGMFIGYIFVSDEIATLVAILTSISFLVFSGSLILPLEAMSENIASIAQFNPFVIGEAALRKAFVINLGVSNFITELGILLLYVVVLLALVFYAQKINKIRQSK